MFTSSHTKTRSARTQRDWVLACALSAASLFSGSAFSQDSGFFTGLRLVPQANSAAAGAWTFAAPGLKLGQALEFSRPAESSNPIPNAATAFGGYQFNSGLTLGAALNTSSGASTLNFGGAPSDGVGIRFDAARWTLPAPTSNVNVDVVSAFNYRNYLSVYGKVGVGRTDAKPGEVSFIPGQPERTALSYGVGVRYDFSPNIGLKFELSRGTRFGTSLKTYDEPDSLNVGVRWSF